MSLQKEVQLGRYSPWPEMREMAAFKNERGWKRGAVGQRVLGQRHCLRDSVAWSDDFGGCRVHGFGLKLAAGREHVPPGEKPAISIFDWLLFSPFHFQVGTRRHVIQKQCTGLNSSPPSTFDLSGSPFFNNFPYQFPSRLASRNSTRSLTAITAASPRGSSPR
jgi:hypothetical protein